MSRSMKGTAAIGVAMVAAHAAGFVALAARSGGDELVVEVHAPLAAPSLTIDATMPPALAPRVTTTTDGDHANDRETPGLRRRRWSTRYRGGFTREVGVTQLVGPFQDPAAHACSGRVVVGQRLLDDGHAGTGTIAGAVAELIDRELRGEKIFPIGAYRRTAMVTLRWAQLATHPGDRAIVGDAPHGYVRASANIVFDRVEVPIVVAFVPARAGKFRIAAHAALDFDSSIVQWLSD